MRRKTHQFLHSTVIASGLLCFLPVNAFSAGFALIEHSASGMGNSYAGAAAVAEDASTIYFNPAGLSKLEDSQLLLSGHLIFPHVDYEDDGSLTADGTAMPGRKNTTGDISALVPNFYLSTAVNSDLSLGLGINVPFGLTTEYDDDWVGRYHAVRSHMLTVNINPSLSLKLTDKVSIGAGFNIQYIDVELTSAVDFGGICASEFNNGICSSAGIAPQESDGFAKVKGDGWGTGINFGALIQLSEQSRLGIAYRSSVSHELSGDVDFTVPGAVAQTIDFETQKVFHDTDAKASVTLPASASISAVHDVNEKTTLLADLTWTGWSSFDELRIRYPGSDTEQPDSATTTKWNDVYRISFAANHQLNNKYKVRVGAAFDQTPVPDEEHRTPRIPGTDRVWLSAGVGVDITPTLHLDMGYAHLFGQDVSTKNTYETDPEDPRPNIEHTLIGDYQSSVDIFSAQIVWKF